jgi:hypothetical protein
MQRVWLGSEDVASLRKGDNLGRGGALVPPDNNPFRIVFVQILSFDEPHVRVFSALK